MIRLFAALVPPPDTVSWLQRLQDDLPGARWSPPENLHLTLRFAGQIPERQADDLDAELETIKGGPFDLTLHGVGAFEDHGTPRAIWTGVERSEALEVLQRRCESAARRAGLAPDRRTWRPHVTLAYLSGAEPERVGRWIQHNNLARLSPFEVSEFGLYSSWPTKEGSRYRLERAYLLNQPKRGP
ncbi:MAG TPA: RNA 2',3'-cyclic phosphodiesterase [Caulobacteraceae bacterium]|jgi:2'-5' RNA ligase